LDTDQLGMSANLFLLLLSVSNQPAHAADLPASSLTTGDLIITEMMVNPASTRGSWGEWFEVYNNTSNTVNLDGLQVSVTGGSFTVSGRVPVAPGAYAVFAANANPAQYGALPPID